MMPGAMCAPGLKGDSPCGGHVADGVSVSVVTVTHARSRPALYCPMEESVQCSSWWWRASTMPASRPPWMLRRTRGVWSTPVASRGGTGVRVRRVLLPGRHQLQARRREDGPRATGASMGADAEFVARARAAGPPSARRCRCAGHRALPIHPTGTPGAAHRSAGKSAAVGTAGALGTHRVGGQRDDVEPARIALQLR